MGRRLAACADRKDGERVARYENRLDALARGRHGERRSLNGLHVEDKSASPNVASTISMNAINEGDWTNRAGSVHCGVPMPNMASPLVPVNATDVGVSGRLGIELLLILPF
jgi:hypothetical protein